MGSIRFYPFGYWDNTMGVDEQASDENFSKVINLCQELTAKYAFDEGCKIHPDIEHAIMVYFSNGYKDFQLSRADTCSCGAMHNRLIEIRNHEMIFNNPTHFKHLQNDKKL